jgi:hypothetical protein
MIVTLLLHIRKILRYTVRFFLKLAIGFYMLIFQPSVNFYFCENYKA